MAATNLPDAQQFVTSNCSPLEPIDLSIRDALGCVLAETVISAELVPPFANTAMDGFAVRAADVAGVPCELKVIATLAAGAEPSLAVGAGQAIRIMTGAAMPDGADSIVPVENVDPAAPEGIVRVLQKPNLGDAVRPAGEDVQVGQQVFASGEVLTPGHLGVLASVGRSSIRAHRKVRVGVLSTGDELIAPPTPLRVGQIRDSNRHTLLSLVAEANAEPVDLGLARDSEDEIRAKVEEGLATCDALVTSGGVSVGDFDFVKLVLDKLSAGSSEPMRWMQINIKPAKPLAFGLINGKPVFGLPGNPVSCMVSFEVFARPALRQMMGHSPETLQRKAIRAIAGEDLKRGPDGKTHFARVFGSFNDDGRLVVRSSGGQASNLLRTMAMANALAILPDGPTIPAGAEVDVMLLGPIA
jgi:molybdopterin molybdotransferase